MINAVNGALRTLLAAGLPDGVAVRFDPPPATPGHDPAVHLFLYDLREDPRGRLADWHEIRDGAGRVVGRRRPERRYELSYLVTTATTGADVACDLLDAALAALHTHDVLPPAVLAGELAEAGRVVLAVAAAQPRVEPRNLWAALGVPLRAGFDLMVTAAAPTGPVLEVNAPPSAVRLAPPLSNISHAP